MVHRIEEPPMHPAFVHAFDQLGYLVTDANADTFTDAELDAWDQAVQDWCDQNPTEEGP